MGQRSGSWSCISQHKPQRMRRGWGQTVTTLGPGLITGRRCRTCWQLTLKLSDLQSQGQQNLISFLDFSPGWGSRLQMVLEIRLLFLRWESYSQPGFLFQASLQTRFIQENQLHKIQENQCKSQDSGVFAGFTPLWRKGEEGMRAERELKSTDGLFWAERLRWSKCGGVRIPCSQHGVRKTLTSNWTCVLTSLNTSLLICNLGILYIFSRYVIVIQI